MRVAEVKVYQFAELDQTAQTKVLDRFAQTALEYDSQHWFENLVEDAKESASFKLESVDDNPVYGDGKFIDDAEATARAILANHGDVCDTYALAQTFLKAFTLAKHCRDTEQEKVDLMDDDDSITGDSPSYIQATWLVGEFEIELEDLTEEFRKDIAHEFAKMWSKEIEYQTSEDAIKDSIEANEYEFLEDGRSLTF